MADNESTRQKRSRLILEAVEAAKPKPKTEVVEEEKPKKKGKAKKK